MNEPVLSVKFFRTEKGGEPVREFLRGLSPEDRKSIGADIKEVQFGWPLGMPLVRKMQTGLWEIRCHLERRTVRVFFAVSGKDMVLLHAFVKKTQKTPQSELDAAKVRKAQLERRS